VTLTSLTLRHERPVWPDRMESVGEPLTCDYALTASRAVWISRPALAPVPGSRDLSKRVGPAGGLGIRSAEDRAIRTNNQPKDGSCVPSHLRMKSLPRLSQSLVSVKSIDEEIGGFGFEGDVSRLVDDQQQDAPKTSEFVLDPAGVVGVLATAAVLSVRLRSGPLRSRSALHPADPEFWAVLYRFGSCVFSVPGDPARVSRKLPLGRSSRTTLGSLDRA
jgi:hypothetical protein